MRFPPAPPQAEEDDDADGDDKDDEERDAHTETDDKLVGVASVHGAAHRWRHMHDGTNMMREIFRDSTRTAAQLVARFLVSVNYTPNLTDYRH